MFKIVTLGHNFLMFKPSEKENYQHDKMKHTIIAESKAVPFT